MREEMHTSCSLHPQTTHTHTHPSNPGHTYIHTHSPQTTQTQGRHLQPLAHTFHHSPVSLSFPLPLLGLLRALVFGAVHEGFTNNIPLDRQERCCTSWLLVEHMDIPFWDLSRWYHPLLSLPLVAYGTCVLYSDDYDTPVCDWVVCIAL